MRYRRFIKDALPRTFALFLIILLIPFFLIISMGLLVTQGKSIFFVQERSGKNLRKFMLLKFRTLQPGNSKSLELEHRDYTYFGKVLRTTGIDELPQLINIIKGEMAFIGPRPMPVEYESRYSLEHLDRFMVKPGITGWAQVNGRNCTTWGRRFELDNWYVNNANIAVDLKIIWMTIHQSLVPSKNEITMEVFKGTNLA